MLHGCMINPISPNFFRHLLKFGRRVLTTCEIALAWPCTTWHRPGLRTCFQPSRLRQNFSKISTRSLGSAQFFGSVTKALPRVLNPRSVDLGIEVTDQSLFATN